MGTPPSYADFLRDDDSQPTKRQEAEAIETNPAALLLRIADLERTRAVDAARIGVLDSEVRALKIALHGMVDQTDPNDRIGVALTLAGLAARIETLETGR